MSGNAQENLPANWVRTTVGELFTLVGGGTPATSQPDFWNGSIPWITSADIDEKHHIAPRRTITEQAIAASATNLVPQGSVIVGTRVGLGKVGLATGPVCFSQDCQALLYNLHYLNPAYVAFYMSQAVSLFKRIGRGTTINGVTKKQLSEVVFVLPPRLEQLRIVAEIEKQFTRLDAAVAALRKVDTNLKRYRASVLKAACEGRLIPTEAELARAEGRDYEPADGLLARILQERRGGLESNQIAKMKPERKALRDGTLSAKYNELVVPRTADAMKLPDGWCWARVRQVGVVQLGRQRSPKHHKGPYMRPYLRVANVFEDRIDTSDILEMNFSPEEFETYRLEYGHILLNEGQSLELVGRPAMYRGEIPGACFQNTLVRFSSHAGLEPKYALLVFRGYLHSQRFQRIAKWTTNIAHLGAQRFAELEFPLPPVNEQHRIVAEAERRLSVIDELETVAEANLKRAERLRQAILKRAFEGKLVPQDPNDEPACVLLERIRTERAARLESTSKALRKRRVAKV